MANSKDIMMRLKAQDKTKGAFDKVNKSLDRTHNSMNKIKGAMAAAFSTAVILNFAKETLSLADTIGKTADAVGVSTSFLQKYQFAAQQSGLSTEQFNKSMQNFSKMVGQSAIRTNEVGRTLEKLGINIKNNDGSVKKSEVVFKELFVALDNVGSEFERNAILFDIFGRAAGGLAVMSQDGAEAMEALAESATGVISEKAIRDAERFNDTMNSLKRATLLPLQGVVIGTANAFLDLLDAIGLHTRSKTTIQLEHDLAKLNLRLADQNKLLELQKQRYKENDSRLQDTIKVVAELEAQEKSLEDQISSILEKESRFARFAANNEINFDKVNEQLKDKTIPVFEEFANTLDGKLTNAFQNFFNFANKQFLEFETLAKSVAQAVINELIKVLIVEQLVSSIKTGITKFGDSLEYDRLVDFDFEGGGYTGAGARAGGLDGRGGMLAMVHPNETVIDHTKGQTAGGAVNINFNISTVDAAGFDSLLASRKGMITGMINNAMNARGKVGVV